MKRALVIGGTGFVGRHVVEEFHAAGYAVTSLSRSEPAVGFTDDAIEIVNADRSDQSSLTSIAETWDPDVVVDCAAFYPHDVEAATTIFDDVDAYVYVSSGSAYAVQEIPKREGITPLHDCTPAQARDASPESYGPRKAEGDRVVTAAARSGTNAMSVRPTIFYGPKYPHRIEGCEPDSVPSWIGSEAINQRLFDYWIDRIESYDRLLVPGDGAAIWHRIYVEDLASAIHVVAETGVAGEAYNVGDRSVHTLDDILDQIAAVLDRSPERVYVNRRELRSVDLDPNDFVFYHHRLTEYPHILETCKLAALGWESTPTSVAMERTIEERHRLGVSEPPEGPERAAEARLLDRLDG